MKLFGGISIKDNAKTRAVQSMNGQLRQLKIITTNITNFGVVGYQRDIALKTSFAEYIGAHAVEPIKDTKVGRLRTTTNPLDLALEDKGYFQVEHQNGVRLTRDGRLSIDKEGFLRNVNGNRFLGADGEPLQLKTIPTDLKDLKVEPDGNMYIYNRALSQKDYMGRIGIAAEDGTPTTEVKVIQGYLEESNVNLQQEFFDVIPLRRNFEANKRVMIVLSENSQKLLQNLGKPN